MKGCIDYHDILFSVFFLLQGLQALPFVIAPRSLLLLALVMSFQLFPKDELCFSDEQRQLSILVLGIICDNFLKLILSV